MQQKIWQIEKQEQNISKVSAHCTVAFRFDEQETHLGVKQKQKRNYTKQQSRGSRGQENFMSKRSTSALLICCCGWFVFIGNFSDSSDVWSAGDECLFSHWHGICRPHSGGRKVASRCLFSLSAQRYLYRNVATELDGIRSSVTMGSYTINHCSLRSVKFM